MKTRTLFVARGDDFFIKSRERGLSKWGIKNRIPNNWGIVYTLVSLGVSDEGLRSSTAC